MIYAISQVSNRDLQLLYTYRILRHSSALLNAMYRYDSPETYVIEKPEAVMIEAVEYFEYHIQLTHPMTKIPFLEFDCDDEMNLKHIEDFVEVEVTSSELIIRSTADNLTAPIAVTVYWVLSMKQIADILAQIAELLGEDKKRLEAADANIDKMKFSEKPVINPDSLVPNLVKIGTDAVGLIYDDSLFKLTGAMSEQRIINPPQDTISRLLKVHNGVLSFTNQRKESRIYQGFSGGIIKIDGIFKNLVLRDIDSAVMLNNISADFVLIDNCQAVLFRKTLDGDAGQSHTIEKMRVRTSNVTIQQEVTIKHLWLWSRALLVQDWGHIQAVRFVDASCTLCHRDGTIDSFAPSAVQGTYQDLDEIWTKQRQMTYVGGQAESQVPVKKVKVTVIVRGDSPGPGPGPGPTPGGKIYSPYTDWYWSGDSRTVGMINTVHCAGQGYGGQGLSKLRQVTGEIVSGGNQKNISLWWGVNGLENGYADVYEQIAQSAGSNSVVFVATVGRVFNTRGIPDSEDTIGQEGGGGNITIEQFNANIETFNTNLKAALSEYSDLYVLDVWDYIENILMNDYTQLELSAGVGNGLHYSTTCYQKIYDWVCSQITNEQPPDLPDAPTDTHAGVIWNWFKYAGIPNVSNRPELIAGIIGNCQQESYAAIDVLGCKGKFYGPWCESNAGFRNYMTSNGFTFHTYTTTPGDASNAIPYAFTWLTQQSDSWVNWLAGVIDQVSSQTGEAGARAYAELFCLCVERCVGGSDAIQDPGVVQIMHDFYGGTTYYYQDLGKRRDNAAAIYHQFMGV